MTLQEARCRLAARRPNGADDADPVIAEALILLRQNPKTEDWVRLEQSSDQQIAAQLRQVKPPSDLKERLLAGRPLTYAPTPTPAPEQPVPKREYVTRAPVPAPQKAPWPWGLIAGGVAAVLAVAATFVMVDRHNQAVALAAESSTVAFEQFAAAYLTQNPNIVFDFPTSDYSRITAWLELQPGAVKFSAPPTLARGGTHGCKVFDWNDRKVTLVCFRVVDSQMAVYVVAINRDQLSDSPVSTNPPNVAGWNVAAWTTGDVTYVALTKLDPPSLRRLL